MSFFNQITHHKAQISRLALMSTTRATILDVIQLICPSVFTACYSAVGESALLAFNISTFLPVSVLGVLVLSAEIVDSRMQVKGQSCYSNNRKVI